MRSNPYNPPAFSGPEYDQYLRWLIPAPPSFYDLAARIAARSDRPIGERITA